MDVWVLGILAFFIELVDNGLGGGFGTIMSPLLLIFGYDRVLLFPQSCSVKP